MRKVNEKGPLKFKQETIEFLEHILDTSPDGILVTDATQNILLVNESFSSLFGLDCVDLE
ncbi:MAG: PAS domain-containing protein [Candidatus Brocadiales bacterium]